MDKLGPGVVIARTQGGAVIGGYNPKVCAAEYATVCVSIVWFVFLRVCTAICFRYIHAYTQVCTYIYIHTHTYYIAITKGNTVLGGYKPKVRTAEYALFVCL